MMDEVKLDKRRFHRFGLLPYDKMLDVMRISRAHIYLTVPFVLSWSMMESMAAECILIASDTAPVREVIEHEKNGLLVDFFSAEDVAKQALYALDHQKDLQPLRTRARRTIVERYSLEKLLPLHLDLIKDLGRGEVPPPTAARIGQHHQSTDTI
jgi:glycosyltransferase involved in cell wall biosynthesis